MALIANNGYADNFVIKTGVSPGFSNTRTVTNVLNSDTLFNKNNISIFPAFSGLNISYTSATQVNISSGTVALPLSNTSYYNVQIPSQSVKMDIVGAGGFDAIPQTNKWYYVYIIGNPDQQLVNTLASLSLTPTLPTGYTLSKRIGSIRTDLAANTLLNIIQVGTGLNRTYYWNSLPTTSNALNIINTSTPGTAAVSTFDGAPPVADIIVGMCNITNGLDGEVVSMGKSTTYLNPVSVALTSTTQNVQVLVPTVNGQVAYTLVSGTLVFNVTGWVENL